MKSGAIVVSVSLIALLGTAMLLAGNQSSLTAHPASGDTIAKAPTASGDSCCTEGSEDNQACCESEAEQVSPAAGCCQSADTGAAAGCCQDAGGTCATCQTDDSQNASADEQNSDGDSGQVTPSTAFAQQRGRRGPPPGRGPGSGRGMQQGARANQSGDEADHGAAQFREDHNVFFFLLDHRDSIQRKITNLDDGIETVTESDDPDVTAKIQEHVSAMYDRVDNVNPIHMRDPLFRELFANAKKIHMEMKDTPNGIWVKETSDDPYVAKLLQEHAKTVSLFIRNGREELHKNHPLPDREAAAAELRKQDGARHLPLIDENGKVVQLPSAAAQPRDGSSLCIDITADSAPDELNGGIKKLARFVNIYATAGDAAASAEFTVVLHGGATKTALNDAAYAARFETATNPNLPLMRELRQAGVRFLVCGQSLAANEMEADDVADAVEVAVSALTANVNCQQDGAAMISLH